MLTVILLINLLFPNVDLLRVDFGREQAGADWTIINDGVMGGLSKGAVSLSENSLRYTGKLSLANNGGFSSLRSPWSKYDLSIFKTVRIRMRGSGGEFGLSLENSRAYYEPSYRYQFTPGREWKTIEIPLSKFERTRLGRGLGQYLEPNLASDIIRIGIVKADKNTVPFKLEIDFIEFL